jgi:hypothetical protein
MINSFGDKEHCFVVLPFLQNLKETTTGITIKNDAGGIGAHDWQINTCRTKRMTIGKRSNGHGVSCTIYTCLFFAACFVSNQNTRQKSVLRVMLFPYVNISKWTSETRPQIRRFT